MKFIENCITHVPTECLIEDYQMLMLAKKENDWSQVQTVMDCIAEAIDRYTQTSDNLNFKPSVSTLIAMGFSNGVLACDDYTDVLCAGKEAVSKAMTGGVLQGHCDNCPHHKHGCDPENGELLLSNGFLYDGSFRRADDLIKSLEKDTSHKSGPGS